MKQKLVYKIPKFLSFSNSASVLNFTKLHLGGFSGPLVNIYRHISTDSIGKNFVNLIQRLCLFNI